MRRLRALVCAAALAGCGGGHHASEPHLRLGRCPLDRQRLVGLSEARARQVAARASCSVRVVERDGRQLIVTLDYKADRLDVAVRRGRVTAVLSVG